MIMRATLLSWICVVLLQAGILRAIPKLSRPSEIGEAQGAPITTLCSHAHGHDHLTETDMKIALSLGRSFMLRSQLPAGDFHYQYDWKKGKDDGDEEISSVREAGAAWGLALIALDEDLAAGKVEKDVLAGTRNSLDFFDKHSKVVKGGRRIVVYPGQEKKLGDTGTIALLALAHVDYLRNSELTEKERDVRSQHLRGLMRSLQASVRKDGRVHKSYDHDDGEFEGDSSPYYDGEALLAFVKASKYLGLKEYWHPAKQLLKAGWERNVEKGLRAGKDDKIMKGYYQWSSMAWYEVLTSDQAADFSVFRRRLVDYALWMVQVHDLAKRTKNTGYAFEGMIPAFVVARNSKMHDAERILGCAINEGMRRVSGMQLGHPLAASMAKKAPPLSRTRGGVQNGPKEPLLRIDTTQHQLHAVIQARRLLQGTELI